MATINTWFRDADERQEHINMMRDQKKWPWVDFLPVKHPERMASRSIHDQDKPTTGELREEGVPIVHFDDGTTETFGSLEELVDSGWVVD